MYGWGAIGFRYMHNVMQEYKGSGSQKNTGFRAEEALNFNQETWLMTH